MIEVKDKEQLEFKEVATLLGHTNFREFEREYDDLIFYADGSIESVTEALLEPVDYGTDMNAFNAFGKIKLYCFDGWYLALK